MNKQKHDENTLAGSYCQERLVRLCRFCAQKLDLWIEWKSNHCLYDHATSKPCDECDGENLRNPESIFTVKLRLPNAEVSHGDRERQPDAQSTPNNPKTQQQGGSPLG